MCAAMPMFRVRSSGNLRSGEFGPADADFFFSSVAGIKLPAEMGKRAVRLRHFVCVFAFLDCVALTGSGVLNFMGQCLRHRHAFTSVGVLNDPTHGERDLAGRWHFQVSLAMRWIVQYARSEEHTSELQSRRDLVCRLLLEKKKNKTYKQL